MCGGRSEESCAAIIVDAWKMLHDFPLTRRSTEHLNKSIKIVVALLSSGSGFPKQGNFIQAFICINEAVRFYILNYQMSCSEMILNVEVYFIISVTGDKTLDF